LFESNKNSNMNWHSNVSSLNDDNANFHEKSKCFEYLNEKSIVFAENCKKLKKFDWNSHFQLDVYYWWLISIDTSNRTNNKTFDNDNEKNINEQMICVQNAKLFKNWYVKKQKMMSFCLRTNHRLNDVINC
jgi:hypothetical protein